MSHLKYEPVVLLVQHGILRKISVFLQHAENENFIVLHRRNVSQDELLVKLLTLVSMIVSVVVMRAVSVQTVSMDEQMTKTSVVLSRAFRLCVVMIILSILSQEPVVCHQKNGIQQRVLVLNVVTLKPQVNSSSMSTSRTSAVLEMVILLSHIIVTSSQKFSGQMPPTFPI